LKKKIKGLGSRRRRRDMHIAIQIILGIVATIVVYVLSLWILQGDQIVADPSALSSTKSKQSVAIMDGYAETSVVAGTQWSTVNQGAQNYVMLHRSRNRKGGAQYSYSIWVQIRDTSVVNGQTLFMRGDPTVYAWTKKVGATETHVSDVLVKGPRVRFGSSFDGPDGGLVVEFNTLDDPQGGHVTVTPNPEPIPTTVDSADANGFDETMRQNLFNLIRDRWAMLTFTFEDGIAINEFENGIVVRVYINDVLYKTQAVKGALRQNAGDVYLLPAITNDPRHGGPSTGYTPGYGPGALSNSTVGDLAYYNYALGIEQVRDVFRRGPPKKPATVGVGAIGEPLYLSEYNRLDVYNS
jgi:hypothetical protein